jgi:hypothetical protein
MAALQSQTSAVRVQAAAVFAKLREQHALEARRLLEAPDSSISDTETFARRSQNLADCREIARSPFLDNAVTQALINRARQLEAELAPPVSAPEPALVGAEPVMDDKPASEMTKVIKAHAEIVEAQFLASSRIARLSKSSSGGMERVA